MSSESKTTILEFRNAGFSYGEGAFIRNMKFSIGDGEFIGLLGANGSGKSTILKLAGGILRATEGEVLLWSRPIGTYRNRDRAKLLSYLPQLLDINVPFTVRELVSMGLYPYDIRPSMTVEEALEMTGLDEKASALISTLSGGERRRVFIAMTLLQDAGLVLLDEPLANLDIKYQIELIRLLETLRVKRKISVVMALHDINIASRFEKVILIKEGEIIGTGSPDSVLTADLLYRAFDIEIRVQKDSPGGTYIHY